MECPCALETWWPPRRSANAVLQLAIGLLASTAASAQTPGTWSTTGSLKSARSGHTATLLPNGRVLVAGGFNTSPNGRFNYLSSAEVYTTGAWTVSGSMSTAREAHTATLAPNGKVLVAGGEAFVKPVIFASAELYPPPEAGQRLVA
jgi:hypothetical protein